MPCPFVVTSDAPRGTGGVDSSPRNIHVPGRGGAATRPRRGSRASKDSARPPHSATPRRGSSSFRRKSPPTKPAWPPVFKKRRPHVFRASASNASSASGPALFVKTSLAPSYASASARQWACGGTASALSVAGPAEDPRPSQSRGPRGISHVSGRGVAATRLTTPDRRAAAARSTTSRAAARLQQTRGPRRVSNRRARARRAAIGRSR